MLNKMFNILHVWLDHKFWTFLYIVLCDCAIGCYGDDMQDQLHNTCFCKTIFYRTTETEQYI